MNEDKRARLNLRFALLFETAKRSLLAADLLVCQIIKELEGLKSDIESRIDIGERAIPSLMAAVAFVDFAFRFNEAIRSLPFIKKDTPEIKRLVSSLKPVEDSRHYLQHMRGDLSEDIDIDYPILGALSWVKEMTVYSLSFSQPGTASSPCVVFDTQEAKWISNHVFIVKHTYIDLDSTLAEMHSAFQWICRVVSSSDPTLMQLKWGSTYALAVKFDLRPIDSNPPDRADGTTGQS